MEEKNIEANIPMHVKVNKAKALAIDAIGQILGATGVPAYIMDGILSSILADIRQKEMYEFELALSSYSDSKDTEESDGEHQ